jgi:hypothetical protein
MKVYGPSCFMERTVAGYATIRFHKSTKVILKISQFFSRMISVLTVIQTNYVLSTGSENYHTIMLAT